MLRVHGQPLGKRPMRGIMDQMNILIIDDHQMLVDTIACHLQTRCGTTVVSAATIADGIAVLASAAQPFDVVLLDYRVPGMTGCEAADQVVRAAGPAPVVLFSGTADSEAVKSVLASGIRGFVSKSVRLAQLSKILEAVAAGVEVFPSTLLRPSVDERALSFPGLSGQNRKILELMSEGWTNREIGSAINMAEHNVKAHVRKIFGLLGVSSRTGAVMLAREKGLLG